MVWMVQSVELFHADPVPGGSGRDAGGVLREVHPAHVRRERRLVGGAEEFHEVVRRTAAHEQHARAARRTRRGWLRDGVAELRFEIRVVIRGFGDGDRAAVWS